MSRSRHLIILAAGCALVTAPATTSPDKRLVFNATSSVPVGFYWLDDVRPTVGDLALVRPPPALARWMAARRYLPLNVPLIKYIAAVGGQHVCIQGGQVLVDGAPSGTVMARDRLGRRLLASRVCRHLSADEVFLLNRAPRSLDSRYFGPLSRGCVIGRLSPIWTWER